MLRFYIGPKTSRVRKLGTFFFAKKILKLFSVFAQVTFFSKFLFSIDFEKNEFIFIYSSELVL